MDIVLTYLREMGPTCDLSLEDLTLKLVMLIALTSGQRAQTISFMDVSCVEVSKGTAVFHIRHLTKTCKPGKSPPIVKLTAYPEDVRLCVLHVLVEYLKRTQRFRAHNKRLFVSIRAPHNNVSTQTISRWLKCVLERSGIDTSIFKGHSTRSASTSAALRHGVAVDDILSAAGWSSARTFAVFYNKTLESTFDFGSSVLQSVK